MTEGINRYAEFDLTVNQVEGLKVALRNIEGNNPISLTFDGKRLIVDCPESTQRWQIGPSWSRSSGRV